MAQLRQASETAKLPYNEAKRQKIPQIIAEKEMLDIILEQGSFNIFVVNITLNS